MISVTDTAAAPQDPTTEDLAASLRFSVTRLARLLRQQSDAGLTPTQMAALATVDRCGPLPVGTLADEEQIGAPTATKIVEKLHAGPTLTNGPVALIGTSAVVVEPVDKRGGRIQLAGELWSARSLDDITYDTGVEVFVTSIDGATAVVATPKEF